MNFARPFAVAILFALTIGFATAAAAQRPGGTYIIKRDYGGNIVSYHKRARKLEAAATRVVIDGVCASACTAYLRNACATRRARIGFHGAHLKVRGGRQHGKRREAYRRKSLTSYYNRLLASHYPARVRTWISRNGGLPDSRGMLWLKGREAQDVIGAC